MAISAANSQTSFADDRLLLSNPLLLFAVEDPPSSSTPDRIVEMTSYEHTARPYLFASSVERPRRRTSKGRQFAGAALLVAGLLSGYAAGMATATRIAEDQNRSKSLATTRADSRSQSAALPALADQLPAATATAVNDLPINKPDVVKSTPQTSASSRSVPRVGAAPATDLGELHVESLPAGAQVQLDDRLVATTPFRLYRVPSGSHTVRMEMEGYKPVVMPVTVAGGSRVRVAASLEIDSAP